MNRFRTLQILHENHILGISFNRLAAAWGVFSLIKLYEFQSFLDYKSLPLNLLLGGSQTAIATVCSSLTQLDSITSPNSVFLNNILNADFVCV